MSKKTLLVGVSGASGMPVLKQSLRILHKDGTYNTVLVATDSAALTYRQEMGEEIDELKSLVTAVADIKDIGSLYASGSSDTLGMLILPCSMKTLAGIDVGYSDNLLLRAADVTIKEKRTLVLAVRESPLSPIHLEHMKSLSQLHNVYLSPLMMEFYTKPRYLEEMVYQTAARVLRPFGIKAEGYQSWKGIE